MHKVKLVSAFGEFVSNVFIPPFPVQPAIVMWGTRFFSLQYNDDCTEFVGREVFAVAALTESELNEHGMKVLTPECPSGLTIGKDHQKVKECVTCPLEFFTICGAMASADEKGEGNEDQS